MKWYRTIITTSDIALLLGKSMRTAQRIMQEMRGYFGKDPKQYITFDEFSMYTGISMDEIEAYLKKLPEMRQGNIYGSD